MWTCGNVVLGSCGHVYMLIYCMVIWSYDHDIMWSCGHLAVSTSGHVYVVMRTCGSVFFGHTVMGGHLLVSMFSRGRIDIWSCCHGSCVSPNHAVYGGDTPSQASMIIFKQGDFLVFMYVIQQCIICRTSNSTVSEDAGIEPRTLVTSAGQPDALDLNH